MHFVSSREKVKSNKVDKVLQQHHMAKDDQSVPSKQMLRKKSQHAIKICYDLIAMMKCKIANILNIFRYK